MIADLKADSERWETERRQTASRGQPANGISSRDSNKQVRHSNTPIVEYRSSTTHQSRQYYGPTEAAPASNQAYAATGPYASTAPAVPEAGYGAYQQQQQYGTQPTAYTADQGYPVQNDYYVSGADYGVANRAPAQAGTVPRTNTTQYQTAYQTQPDNRGYAYPAQTAPSPVYAQASTSSDIYGRGAYNQALLS
jgi:hypothetical protein